MEEPWLRPGGYYAEKECRASARQMTEMFDELFMLRKYGFLLRQLVRRDFKTKYRGSILGAVWSVLNPLLNMLVLSVVFSRIFNQVDNYMLYVLSGITVFSYFSEATQMGLVSVVTNYNLFGKVKLPITIFPISKVFSSAINLGITTMIFLVLSWFFGFKPTWYYLLIPVVLVLLILFTIGITFLLSMLEVFFRDTQHLYSIICTIWMYVTPILYPFETTISPELQPLFRINPMLHFVEFFRDVAFYGQMPSATRILTVVGFSIGSFLIGLIAFCKKKDAFIYYM